MADMTHSSTSSSESEEEAANVPVPPGAAPPQPAAAPPEVIASIVATMRGIRTFSSTQRTSIRRIRDALIAAHPGYDAVVDDMIRQVLRRMSQEQQATICTPQPQNHRQSPGAGGATA